MDKPKSQESNQIEDIAKAAGLRILENAFGRFGDKGQGTPGELVLILEEEIVKENPSVEGDDKKIRNIRRFVMGRFFEIVADEEKTPRGKKYDEIMKKFMDDSVAMYRSKNK